MQKLPRFEHEQILAENLKSPAVITAYEKLSLGTQIKKLRKRLNLKQSDLAKRLKTSQSAVARMEAGKQNLSIELLVAVALCLGKKIHLRFQ